MVRLATSVALISTLVAVAYANADTYDDILEREYDDLLEREPFLEFLNIIPKVADVGVGALGQLINKGISKIKRRDLEDFVEGRMSEEELEAREVVLDEFLEARDLVMGFNDDLEERSFGEGELEELD
ncbi:hypothetical protein DFP72DRAFT_174349 [Ephemerocybe angulata]|uniref:Antimicrobial peptide n=1 Tax=Ephemerocybe angulata TaxID=980116 RepID=A0A8H6I422_9AGAR|nr:hypothetical protein DFP72DRAFT_845238 [Tulosesus angulatus]KAF6758520.1 hypothetical protein DFP72DRAFT_174349 [Tulosesus angulatus]